MQFDSQLKRGKKPPQAIELEQAVIGAMLIDTKATDSVFSIIRSAGVFIKDKHRHVYTAIERLYSKSVGIDLLTVSEELRALGKLEAVGGDYFLIQLTQKVASSAHVEHHSRILIQKYLMRRVIMMNNQINALAYDEATDVFDLLDNYQNEFDKIVDITRTGRRTITFDKSLDELKKSIERLSANTDEVPLVGVTTGFKRTDIHTGGYRAGDLIILAARPGMGKTSKVLRTATENVKAGVSVGMFSIEMSMQKLTARIVAIDTSFHLKQLLKTGFKKTSYFETYDMHSERMKKYPLIVDDSGANDISEIIIVAKAWKRTKGIKLLIIDYLQLMDDKSLKTNNREAIISSISRKLKLLAKELELPIIALSQLSRAVETRGGSKRPMLSDLRESGAIEQDADIVEFIYRPSYYGLEMRQEDYELNAIKNCIALGANTEINFAKFRDGSLGTAPLKWVADKTKFIDVEDIRETVEYIDRDIPNIEPFDVFHNSKTVFDA